MLSLQNNCTTPAIIYYPCVFDVTDWVDDLVSRCASPTQVQSQKKCAPGRRAVEYAINDKFGLPRKSPSQGATSRFATRAKQLHACGAYVCVEAALQRGIAHM